MSRTDRRGCRARGILSSTPGSAAGACRRSAAQSSVTVAGARRSGPPVVGNQGLRCRAVALVDGAAGRLAVRLVADVVGQLDLHRPLHQPLGQGGEHPAGPEDLLLVEAPASSSSITRADPSIGRHPESMPDPRRPPPRSIAHRFASADTPRAAGKDTAAAPAPAQAWPHPAPDPAPTRHCCSVRSSLK